MLGERRGGRHAPLAASYDEDDVRVRPNRQGTRPRTKDRPDARGRRRGLVVTVDRGRYTLLVATGDDASSRR